MNCLLKSFKILTVFLFLLQSCSDRPSNEFARSGIAVGVIVDDLEKSLDFYTKVIGMMKVREFVVDSVKARRMGLGNGESFEIKVLKLIDSEDASEWKLMSFGKKSDTSKQEFLPQANGFRYVTIFVKNMTPVLERIHRHGVKTLGESPLMLDETRMFVLIRDLDGNFIELIGPK
ncbi:MAG: VOC family protein [Bacteroidetes bacterium]|nr:VOC family protein [Bacteroidota bacterium]